MSVIINLNSVSDEIADDFEKDLHIHKKKGGYDKKKSHVKTYRINDDASAIHIPMSYALTNLQVQNTRKYPKSNIKFNGTLRDYQKESYDISLSIIKDQQTFFLSLYCGFGKTFMAIKMACDLGYKVGVLTHNVLVKGQWVKMFQEVTNAKVVVMDGVYDKLPDGDVFIFMVKKAAEMDIKVTKKIGFLVVDEARVFCSKTRTSAMLNFCPKYLLGLSADINRPDGLHKILPLLFGDLMMRKISTKHFIIHKVNTEYVPTVQNMRFSGKLDWNKVITSLAEMKNRNRLICNIIKERPKNRFMILCKRKNHVNELYEMLKRRGETCETLMGTKKNYDLCRVLVGTYSKMGVGFDDVNACSNSDGSRINCCIFAMSTKDIEQFAGRVFRSRVPEIYDIVDDFSTLKNSHWNQRKKWYIQRGGEVLESYRNL